MKMKQMYALENPDEVNFEPQSVESGKNLVSLGPSMCIIEVSIRLLIFGKKNQKAEQSNGLF